VTGLIDAHADVPAIQRRLEHDPRLKRLVMQRPGVRIPGTTDPFELSVRAVLGQQISVAGARTLAGRVARQYGRPLTQPFRTLTATFPGPRVLAAAPLEKVGLPCGRAGAIRSIARLVAAGDLHLDPDCDSHVGVEHLLRVKGIGPWTAAYIALRALGDRDAMPASDLGLRQALGATGVPLRPEQLAAEAEGWRPWRGYGAVHLWSTLLPAS
jgi:AraC family transcriptional regulator of adaptative response / DNA-3-methyladenine glycosylase II